MKNLKEFELYNIKLNKMFKTMATYYSKPRGVRNMNMGRQIGGFIAKKTYYSNDESSNKEKSSFKKFIFAMIVIFLITQLLKKCTN